MSFLPSELTVGAILDGNRIYNIPNFQRDFSWDNDNFDDFFYDLFRSSGLDFDNLEVGEESKYFLGIILLIGDRTHPNELKPYEVIDGQQRLTTITLFFAAIRDLIKETDKNYKTDFDVRLQAKIARKGKDVYCPRIVNSALNPILPVEILDINDRKSNGACVTPSSRAQEDLIEHYEYIKTKLLCKSNVLSAINDKCKVYKNLSEFSDDDYIRILENFGNHLSNSVIICIFSDEKDEAYTLFRNLNYRGKHLSQSDLIKNEIYSLIGKGDSDGYAFSKWKNIENNIYSAEESMEKFIYHYMCGRYAGIITTKLFEKFSSVVQNEKDCIEFLESLEHSSEYYKVFTKPSDNDTVFGIHNYFKTDNNQELKRYFEFFKNIGISQLRILLISLFECRDGDSRDKDSRDCGCINNTIFAKFIKLVAQHQCLHVLVKSSANKLNSVYSHCSRRLLELKEINDKKISCSEAMKIFDEFSEDLNKKLPDKNAVIETDLKYDCKPCRENSSAKNKNREIIRFILSELSEKEQTKDTNRANDGLGFIHNSTLEHIIDRQSGEDNIYSIGNLLLLERDIHTNESKKKEMYEKSRITLTRRFFDDYKDFNSGMILDRKRDLLEAYYDLVKK
ncbi:DUF262 domain-containing protein [Gardnerella vaginalis]|uniref:DUF262 domain-containing protein n=1 Tax=Gardnerella vaginalis TaxID=2702 RepID=UPI0035C6F50B